MSNIIYKIIFFLFFIIIFAFIPIYIIITIIKRFYYSHISKNWPTVKGKIMKSEYNKTKYYNYMTNIEYSYEINNNKYTGNRIYLNIPFFITNKKLFRLFEKYYNNKEIDIIYNRKKPEISFIEKNKSVFNNFILLLFSLIMILCGIFIFINILDKFF